MNFRNMVWRKKNRRDRFLYYFSTLCLCFSVNLTKYCNLCKRYLQRFCTHDLISRKNWNCKEKFRNSFLCYIHMHVFGKKRVLLYWLSKKMISRNFWDISNFSLKYIIVKVTLTQSWNNWNCNFDSKYLSFCSVQNNKKIEVGQIYF